MQRTWYDRKTRRVRDKSCGDVRVYLDLEIRRVFCRRCGAVRQEKLAFLANNPFYTKRFAHYVGRRHRRLLSLDSSLYRWYNDWGQVT